LKEASPMSGPSSSGVDMVMTPRLTVPARKRVCGRGKGGGAEVQSAMHRSSRNTGVGLGRSPNSRKQKEVLVWTG
jgi:hypothetical protein